MSTSVTDAFLKVQQQLPTIDQVRAGFFTTPEEGTMDKKDDGMMSEEEFNEIMQKALRPDRDRFTHGVDDVIAIHVKRDPDAHYNFYSTKPRLASDRGVIVPIVPTTEVDWAAIADIPEKFDPTSSGGSWVKMPDGFNTGSKLAEIPPMGSFYTREDLQPFVDALLAEPDQGPVETHMGVSKARVVRVEPEPEMAMSRYQEANVNNSDRPIVGLKYLSTQRWTDEDSVVTYLNVVAGLGENEMVKEQYSAIYDTMMAKLKDLLVVEGEINLRFADILDKAGHHVSCSVDRTEVRIELTHTRSVLKEHSEEIEFADVTTRRYINFGM